MTVKFKKITERKNAMDYLKKDTHIAELKYDGQFRFAYNDNGDYYLTNKLGERREMPTELLEEFQLKFDKELKVKKPFYNNFILAGELVYIDPSTGSNHRTQAQNPNAEMTYMVFDIVKLGDEDLTDKDINGKPWTWLRRRVELDGLCEFAEWLPGENNCVVIVDYVKSTEYKEKLLEFAKSKNLEGLILKDINATYSSKSKTDMMKIKFACEDDYIVIGYTNSKGTKTGKREDYFRSLVLAQYDKEGTLKATGRCGGGFNDIKLAEVNKLLNKKDSWTLDKRSNKQLDDKDYNCSFGHINWIPKKDWFVIEVRMQNKTEYGVPFQPRFTHVRDDKLPSQCVEVLR